jgi:hypothetical protein
MAAVKDIFARAAAQVAGVFASDLGRLSFGADAAGSVSTTLVQNMQVTYMQNVTRLYEIGVQGGKANIYYIGGRSQGQMSIARVVGPSVLLSAYYSKYGDVCNAKGNDITFNLAQTDCSSLVAADFAIAGPIAAGSLTYTMKGCVITQVGISVAAADMLINENSTLMFASLVYAAT